MGPAHNGKLPSDGVIYGYIGGIRSDSIDAQYATIGRRRNQSLSFDYGQFRDGKNELTVTDNKRVPLELANTTSHLR